MYVRAKVTGDVPLRDALTRESVQPGGEVTLIVRQIGEDPPKCRRHPKRGAYDLKQRCVCHTTVLELLPPGAISDVKPFDPDKKPVK